MTDLSNNGSGATAQTAGVKATGSAPKRAGRRARTSTATQDAMTDTQTNTAVDPEELSRIKAALQKIEARAEELRRWGMARQEMAREVVEERPLAVVGAAFGVGLLIGLISSRI
jgi:ElaB/YqjD/DUF883 family membrane-anchored ribosome-binding protein